MNTRSAPQGAAVRSDTHSCGPCDGCDVAVGSDHGDPYVFPAGVAELEHVWIQAHHQGFEHPITEYQQAPRPSLLSEGPEPLQRVRTPVALTPGAPCRQERPRSGRAQLRRARARCRSRVAGHRPRRRRGRAVDRAVRPRPRPRAPPRRRRPVPLRPRHGRRRRRVVAAARRGDGLRPLGDVRRGRQGRLVRPAVPRLRRLAHAARPRAQRSRRPTGHRLGRLHARAARHRAHRQRQPAAGARRRHQPPGGRWRGRLRHLEPAARPHADDVRRRAAADAAGGLRRPHHHRDARLPGPGPARGAARQGTGPHPGRRGGGRRAHQAGAHAPPLDAGRRHRPRDGRPRLRQPGPQRPRAAQASQEEGGRAAGGLRDRPVRRPDLLR